MIRTRAAGFLLLFISLTAGLGAQEWYRSSTSGIPGVPLAAGPSDAGWSLSVERTGNLESRTLYSDGALYGTTILIRNDGRLVAREERDADDSLLSRVEYAYDADGNPRAVFIGTDENGLDPDRVATLQTVSADTAVLRTADGSGDDWQISEMDLSRNPVKLTSLESGAVVEEVTWNRNDDGRLLEEVRTTGSDVSRSRYDRDGRLMEESLTRNGAVIRLRTYLWQENNLIQVVEQGEGRIVVRDITWKGNRISSEVRKVDGTTVSETTWSTAENRIETLFRDGVAIIRVHWNDDVKVREEFLKDGEVIRVQENFR